MFNIMLPITSLCSVNISNDLQPIDDWNGQLGILEIDSNGDLTPMEMENIDKFLELDSNGDIQPKE